MNVTWEGIRLKPNYDLFEVTQYEIKEREEDMMGVTPKFI